MIKKISVLIICWAAMAHITMAQQFILPVKIDTNYSFVGSSWEYYSAGNAITNKFAKAYLQNEFIDSTLKAEVVKNQNDNNMIGFHNEVDFYYCQKKSKIGWIAGLRFVSHAGGNFTDDLFNLYFNGNSPYKGDTLSLENFVFNYTTYQTIYGGVIFEKNRETNFWRLAVMPQYVKGQRLNNITNTGSLYTAPDISYINLDMDLKGYSSDSIKKKLDAFNGHGAGLSFNFQFGKPNNYTVTVFATDAGFVKWNNNTYSLQIDTSYYYDGIEIQNLLDSISLQVNGTENYKSSLINYRNQKGYTTMMPARIGMSIDKWLLSEKLVAGIGFHYIADQVFTPQVHLRVSYHFNNNFSLAVAGYKGGYKPYNIDLSANYQVRNWFFGANARFLEEIFQFGNGTAQGIALRAGLRF
ncbi:MAG: hypothetical protein IPO27_16550 [Bacteroidetes bacterium]|nr:hypothetical protein [Bacteroidota bacterium]